MKVLRVSDIIHKQLKQEAKDEGRTLQWWVEHKLTVPTASTKDSILYATSTDKWDTVPPVHVEMKESPDAFIQPLTAADKYPPTKIDAFDNKVASLEKACCFGIKPCVHWVWQDDGSERYINSLSGRSKEL